MPGSNGSSGSAIRHASAEDRPGRRPQGGPEFVKREYPPDLQRGLFTLFIDDDQGQHIAQVWASTPGGAASLMAPWAKGRLRRARRGEEVPVELVGWDDPETPSELSERSGIPQDELDPGLVFGIELCNVWMAEHTTDGAKSTLYAVETVYLDPGMVEDP